ncbi:MAG: MOSC domain-containing protein [Armatimonadetes bacterium]|nr:MOSC domain-containing protein [Armatimonadota bacterium]
MSDSTGVIEAILVYPTPRCVPVPLAEATAVANVGLREDRNRPAERQVTLLSREDWQRATAALDRELPPETRRANLVVGGIPLAETIDRRLCLGEAVVHVRGEMKPCARMDEATPGLRACLQPDRRAGVYSVVESGGRIAVGDAVRVLSEE